METTAVRLTLRVSRTANLFHFVNNLAAWHFACRQHYNRAWLAETGPLSAAEEAALDEFRAIVREFPYGPRWLGRAFILGSAGDGAAFRATAWRATRDLVGPDTAAMLWDVFATLKPRFERIWRRDQLRLDALTQRLDGPEGLFRSAGFARAAAALETYFAAPFPGLVIDLLISRGENWSAGGANEGPGHVTLEVLETRDLGLAAETVLHEAAHLMGRRASIPLLESVFREHDVDPSADEQGWGPLYLVEEALTTALVPGGCLSPFLDRTKDDYAAAAAACRTRGEDQLAILYTLAANLMPRVEGYIRADRTFDRLLAEQACRSFLDSGVALGT